MIIKINLSTPLLYLLQEIRVVEGGLSSKN